MSYIQDERIVINVRGCRFETYKTTLEQFPNTLLGCQISRTKLYDPQRKEILLDRDKEMFNYVLFFYQSKGILSKPDWISDGVFYEELDYFALQSAGDTDDEDSTSTDDSNEERNQFYSIWQLLEKPESSDAAGLLGKFNLCIILVSTIVYCLETIKSVRHGKDLQFFIMESMFVAWYTIEYLLRVLSAPGRLRFVLSALGVIDVMAIIPYYLTTIIENKGITGGKSWAVIRLVRLIRVCRVLKLSRYNRGLRILAKTIVSSNSQIKSLFLCLIIAVILMSSLIYAAENVFGERNTFESIPDTFWFTIVTMTSVGYGDMVPMTILGKISAVICFLGGIILLLSLPVPVLISHFKQSYKGGQDDSFSSKSDGGTNRDIF
eukprot:Seg671.5 transcript_id=Seg671.5/GoldUCD/mRNA.D3Y31 product="Potassium voltage-gated channel subfamily A member 2" protein_id=Seg671.5/GoldUCD/D3Y31